MITKLHRARGLAAACVAAWALVACGGGNGDTSNSGAASSNAIPATGVSGQDSAAPTLTNNVAVDGRTWINYRRSQVRMSALAENSQIDIAAQGHSDYQRINNTVTHVQTAGMQGFTGVNLQDRLQAAGYTIGGANAIGEVISATSKGTGFFMAEQLITAIYHRFVIFEPVFKEIGTGSAANPAGYTYFTADMAANNGLGAGLPKATVATWPFDGQTQVIRNFFSDQEEPDPVPGVNEVGYPISVHANMSTVLAVQSFTVQPHGGTNLSVKQITNEATNAQGQVLPPTAAAIIPLAPLAAATTYDVSFTGTVDGTLISKRWSFTTAN